MDKNRINILKRNISLLELDIRTLKDEYKTDWNVWCDNEIKKRREKIKLLKLELKESIEKAMKKKKKKVKGNATEIDNSYTITYSDRVKTPIKKHWLFRYYYFYLLD